MKGPESIYVPNFISNDSYFSMEPFALQNITQKMKVRGGCSCSVCRLQLWMSINDKISGCDNCQAMKTKMISSTGKRAENNVLLYASTSSSRKSMCMPSNSMPKKRALLCGVSYKNKRKYRLKGAVNDVKSMKDFLIESDFPVNSIRILTEEPGSELSPTRKNILDALNWLVAGSQSGDSLLFYFSGHGLRQPDFNNDEVDGFDETICPVDFRTEGMIIDNDLNRKIVRPLKPGVTLHAIIDACHSGTVLDLPFVYSLEKDRWVDNSPPSKVEKGTSGGLAICFSACTDDQLAADTNAFEGKAMKGALTHTLINTIRRKKQVTYHGLLTSICTDIEEATKAGCLQGRLLTNLCGPRFKQVPQLSASHEFDVHSKVFKL
ncbi:hypothetical protein RJ641_018991 [Dillenia turbinata]|uniref:Peptidase C14 caspase domain-containing protein n=1 Tax=Dillenia turbinata TaxID=194707 RepID=A0AAN8UID6_9MAGN